MQPLRGLEADFGRTSVLGDDPAKVALRDALESVWERGCNYFHAHPDVTWVELYHFRRPGPRDRWVFRAAPGSAPVTTPDVETDSGPVVLLRHAASA
nr:hypothetical protein GCM10017611_35330 [Rhodococcus wratislaviensis]